jgi:hypothetical protein
VGGTRYKRLWKGWAEWRLEKELISYSV